MDKKSITLLGSTGSIGVQALEVAAFHGMNIEALCFGSNIKLGEAQVRKFSPRFCAVFDEKAALDLKTRKHFLCLPGASNDQILLHLIITLDQMHLCCREKCILLQ